MRAARRVFASLLWITAAIGLAASAQAGDDPVRPGYQARLQAAGPTCSEVSRPANAVSAQELIAEMKRQQATIDAAPDASSSQPIQLNGNGHNYGGYRRADAALVALEREISDEILP